MIRAFFRLLSMLWPTKATICVASSLKASPFGWTPTVVIKNTITRYPGGRDLQKSGAQLDFRQWCKAGVADVRKGDLVNFSSKVLWSWEALTDADGAGFWTTPVNHQWAEQMLERIAGTSVVRSESEYVRMVEEEGCMAQITAIHGPDVAKLLLEQGKL